MRERRYSDKEVGEILARAASSQSGNLDLSSPDGITLSELTRVAEELGIESGHIEIAAADLETKRQLRTRAHSNGVLLEQTVACEYSDELWEQLVTEGQTFTGTAGRVSIDGGSSEWRSGSDTPSFTLRVTRKSGRTHLKLIGDASGSILLVVAFCLIGGIFACLVPVIVASKAHLAVAPLAVMAAMVLIIVAAIAATTDLIKRQRRKLLETSHTLMDNLVSKTDSSSVREHLAKTQGVISQTAEDESLDSSRRELNT